MLVVIDGAREGFVVSNLPTEAFLERRRQIEARASYRPGIPQIHNADTGELFPALPGAYRVAPLE